jgi:hypothetical protein
MKRSIIGVLVFLPLIAIAGISDWVSVVRVTSNFREVTFEVLANADYTARTKEAWSRNRVLTQATRLARDEWIKAEDTKAKTFPASVTSKAELKRLKTFPDATEAEAYSAKMAEEEEARNKESKATSYLEKKVKILQDEIDNASDSNLEEPNWIERREADIATLQVKISERRAMDQERQDLAEEAKGTIEAHIDSLVAAPEPAPEPATDK